MPPPARSRLKTARLAANGPSGAKSLYFQDIQLAGDGRLHAKAAAKASG
ncbi:hypothetical protein RBY4I_1708 [Rhodobacterales bacterium Y4I]|nr:hypothetical protein RBY4I_1708 [Rhodobacterales bacterium Y4I]